MDLVLTGKNSVEIPIYRYYAEVVTQENLDAILNGSVTLDNGSKVFGAKVWQVFPGREPGTFVVIKREHAGFCTTYCTNSCHTTDNGPSNHPGSSLSPAVAAAITAKFYARPDTIPPPRSQFRKAVMGMYTGFRINVELKKDTPREVIDLLSYMTFNITPRAAWIAELPQHEFFQCDRWDSALCCQSAYFPENETDQPEQGKRLYREADGRWRLHVSASSKAGPGAYSLLLKWLRPYVDPPEYGKEVGEYQYEESESPTVFSFHDGSVMERYTESPTDVQW